MSAVPIKRVPLVHPAPSIFDQTENHYILCGCNNHVVSMPMGPTITVTDKWDSEHVRLPCSEQSLYPVKKKNDDKITGLRKRWSLICDGLFANEITSSRELKNGILLYNSRFKAARNWSMAGLLALIDDDMTDDERDNFFTTVLPTILQLVKQTKYILNKPIPLCRQQSNKTITFNQLQCACILANSFLCTWSRRNSFKADSEYANFPMINFNGIFSHDSEVNKEKMKCLIHYFDIIAIRQEDGFKFGNITFERRSVMSCSGGPDEEIDNDITPNWRTSSTKFRKSKVSIYRDVSIHDFPECLQADFANKFLGGGVIGTGCVQEEILFTVCPELMVGMLFNEVMADNEAIIITGAETFSDHEGYGWDFKFKGPHRTKTLERDSSGRLQSQVVAIDALCIEKSRKPAKSRKISNISQGKDQDVSPELQQFDDISVERELNKCYAGLYVNKKQHEPFAKLPGFATGKWGCGAFGGDPYLKFLVQVLACAETGRDMNFCCFDENFERMKFQLKSIMNFLYVNECTVADVTKMISNYYLDKKEKRIDSDFYSYLQEVMDLDRETSDEESEGKSEEELEDSFEKDVSIVEDEVKELKADVVEPKIANGFATGGFRLG